MVGIDGMALKKFVSFFLQPYGLIFVFFALGLYFVFKNKNNFAKLSLSFSLFLYLLFGYPIFSNILVKSLEDKYPKYDYSHHIKYIHVLGSGHNEDPLQPLSSQISGAGLKRIIEGVLIYKKTPNAKLIFTGFNGKDEISDGVMSAKLAMELGVKKEDIIIGTHQRDTSDEAKFTKSIVSPNEEFVLVTSATHMPRSMMLFQAEGLKPIAAPTHFKRFYFNDYLEMPGSNSISKSKMAIHEYLGILWMKLKQFLH